MLWLFTFTTKTVHMKHGHSVKLRTVVVSLSGLVPRKRRIIDSLGKQSVSVRVSFQLETPTEHGVDFDILPLRVEPIYL